MENYYVMFTFSDNRELEPKLEVIASPTVQDAKRISEEQFRKEHSIPMWKFVRTSCLYNSADPEDADKVYNNLLAGTKENG